MLSENFEPVYAVLINEDEGNICELKIDISTHSHDIFRLLKGTPTFIGQWTDIDVVLMKCDQTPFELMDNRNRLPIPFHRERVKGPILLVRMDEDSNPKDFRLSEYITWRDSRICLRG